MTRIIALLLLTSPAFAGSLDDPAELTNECETPVKSEAEYNEQVFGPVENLFDLYLDRREALCGDVSQMDRLTYSGLFKPKACDTVGGDYECLRRVFNGSKVAEISELPLPAAGLLLLGALGALLRISTVSHREAK